MSEALTPTSTPLALDIAQARARLADLTVIDVRTPAEYASGHVPGAFNVPLDALRRALPALRQAAARGELLMVCASGNRSANACGTLAEHGISAATLSGGTSAWAAAGHAVERPEGAARRVWGMERQVRFTAGTLVLIGLGLGLVVHPAFQLLSAGVAGGLVYSAVSDTCGMAYVLGKLPHNRPRGTDLDATLAHLRER
ncbi:rhodanese-like domain-containing protein [Streptomyces yaanensis]|uniref:Rhodanese-like domain-containing protein n=1 Tax=Streptomyces yaanensis TaxID=1142239 RepID=A0ABV7S4L4_9ACTN|nr:rhodanese-like domain-containing protein [Streptomyces sp. CGMCC 4.7035]WNB99486.1 rhodanese-like domain-containing protein [Streptomyces sp. CGMCC 4.7035]